MPDNKICTKCGEDKPLEQYSRQPAGRYGRTSRCKACCSAATKQNRDRINESKYRRILAQKYGLTKDQYDAKAQAQDNKCAICNTVPPRWLVVDHDHRTGQVRALLCEACNMSLGLCRDSVEIMEQMITYLDRQSTDL